MSLASSPSRPSPRGQFVDADFDLAGLGAALWRHRYTILRPTIIVALLTFGVAVEAAETLSAHPYELSFFNAAVGGPSHGFAWLNDSNLDWGQDLGRVAAALKSRGEERGTTIAYFGGADPAYYTPTATVWDPLKPAPPPGRYAVSEFLRCCGPESLAFHRDLPAASGAERLRRALKERGTRLERPGMGYSIVLWELKGP